MQTSYFPAKFNEPSFHCPHCNVFASQDWCDIYYDAGIGFKAMPLYRTSICAHCNEKAIWLKGNLVVPMTSTAPLPHSDMPLELIDDYNEAASIVNISPRGAAALLRLVLQKLMVSLGLPGKDINRDIGALVSSGLPELIQQALDIVRVVGNESVHPGQMDITDKHETAMQLFNLINFIIEDRITRPKQINELYMQLPEGKRLGIEQRDKAPK
ncbi:hypothetical protein AM500_21435 [Bacillus sp. FJAT-18017]|uniref:DUF4145 domain-containing protein n=1 Tax=Bacillus sp. FJAT-18017 TaxID=1705566 RepID=UPI0006AEA01E|nr:DUF4145 domain-containing protein [Bacillus sp. FJAT-18017]ALC92069.1 hypothetical protein AM500_21435 [Bacillus sp. FJAT-18017]